MKKLSNFLILFFLLLLQSGLTVADNMFFIHTIRHIAPIEQTSLRWVINQYQNTVCFTQLKKIKENKDYYIGLVNEHLNYLKRKTDLKKPWSNSRCYNRVKTWMMVAIAGLSIHGLIEFLDASNPIPAMQKIEIHANFAVANLLWFAIFFSDIKKLFNYSARLNKRIERDTHMLSLLEQSHKK
ncbi:hypothetical protein Noda2021_06860 [Candidatus Dependentiae bacterium Noda2021]|nr:hypothetical protein Noda2021_06860 [Candidatus Dependentiae bacterium Noda2021]